MSGWAIHSTHVQLDPKEATRFNPCRQRESVSWVPFRPSFARALCSIPSLFLAFAFLTEVFTVYSFWVLWVLHFLCYGFRLFQGPFFSG